MSDIELLDSASNAVVARHTGREYPGVLIQGDTLRIILDDINELREELSAQELESAKDIADSLDEKITTLLTHYENVLAQHNLSLPYMNPVSK